MSASTEPASTENLLPEAEFLDPDTGNLVLSTGQQVEVLRLRTRQLLRALKIITHGAGPAIIRLLSTLQNLNEDNAGEFAAQLVTIILLALPDAEQEALEFFASVLQPVGLVDKPDTKLSKAEREANDHLWDTMNRALSNPEALDTLDIVFAIFQKEGPELQKLGKRIAQLLKLAGLTGQDKPEAAEPVPTGRELAEMAVPASAPASPEIPSEVPSPAPMTSSPPSMDGQTVRSVTSPSDGSARSQTPSSDARSKSSGSRPSSPNGPPAASAPSSPPLSTTTATNTPPTPS